MHDDHGRMIDDEIDAVARSLTAAAPPGALRSNVVTRIRGRSDLAHATRWYLGVAAAAAAMIVIALAWPDPDPPADVGAPLEEATVAVQSPVVALPIDAAPIQPESSVGPNRVRFANEESLQDWPTAFVAPLVIEPLEDLEPLNLNGMEVPMLTVDAMTVAPLSQQ